MKLAGVSYTMLTESRMFVKMCLIFYLACKCHANFRLEVNREPHWPLVDYIAELLCTHRNEDYKYHHIYVEKLLETEIADSVLVRLSSCLSAAILTTQ